jgi:nickel/cobalt transporter (NiCoT) family protein
VEGGTLFHPFHSFHCFRPLHPAGEQDHVNDRTAVKAHLDKRTLISVGSVVGALHLVGWGGLLAVILPAQQAAGGNVGLVLGLAVSAYTLGVRHAFDADHIAAIDNATRQLIAQGRRASSTGFWFALGHSTVVVLAVLTLTLGVTTFAADIVHEDSTLRQVTGIWGGAVSGVFLLTAGLLNLPALRTLNRMRRANTPEAHNQAELEHVLEHRGVLHRLLRPLSRIVSRPTRMYPIGFLFGLGLDTAASVSLFVLAGTVGPGLHGYTVLVLPVLFTAGMTLFDTTNGIMTSRVYRSASSNPHRSVTFNLAITGVSVAIAFIVGGVGLLSVMIELLGTTESPLRVVQTLDLNFLGVTTAVVFALVLIILTIGPRARPAPTGLRPSR